MFLSSSDLQKLRRDLTKAHKKLVFTTGAFDLLHSGHCRYLAEARALGDFLVVGVESNNSRKKGHKTVILDQKVRAELLTYLRSVDAVTIVDETNLKPTLEKLQPDIKYCGERCEPYVSSTDLVRRIAENKILSTLYGSNQPTKPIEINSLPPGDLLSLALKGRVVTSEGLSKLRAKYNQKIVFTAGSFDLLHIGHARYLTKARSMGDLLVVGVPSNEAVRRLKGEGRPLLDEVVRAETLTYFKSVDFVVVFDEPTVLATLEKLRPDVFFTVDEPWNKGYKESPEYKLVKRYGGEVVLSPRQSPFISASLIINKAAGNLVKKIFKECLEADKVPRALKEGRG